MTPRTARKAIAGFLLGVATVAGSAALWLAAPRRTEQALSRASLEQLQTQANNDPANGRVLYYLGKRLLAAGQKAEAAAVLERAASASTDEDVYLAWAAALPDDRAGSILTTFLSFHPQSAKAHLALARLFYLRDDQPHSFEQASEAVRLGSQDKEAWQLLGASGAAIGENAEAEKAYRHIVALAPQDARALLGLAGALLKLDRPDEAMPLLKKAADLAPQDSLVWVALGQAQTDSAQTPAEFEQARQSLLQALRLQPALPVAQLYLAQLALKQKQWQSALDALNKTAPDFADDPSVAFARVQAYRGLGNLTRLDSARRRHKALQDFQTARTSLLARAGSNAGPEVSIQVAQLAEKYGAYQTAVNEYRTALANAPSDPSLVQALALAQRRAALPTTF